jgi:hypothetical protein
MRRLTTPFADQHNFDKVELWTRDDQIERMLFAGTSLDRARAVFADYARRRPAARLMIRQRSRVLDQWPRGGIVGFEKLGVMRSANRRGYTFRTLWAKLRIFSRNP